MRAPSSVSLEHSLMKHRCISFHPVNLKLDQNKKVQSTFSTQKINFLTTYAEFHYSNYLNS